ncbi:MAG: hypothetical protein A07HR60_02168 [uncultured archaeon A07HR60]|jgi:hypothetical protein|nr:MAG: hypothetical protein A07HR60_02168 [uncultured archaeon A07HR60]
MAQTDIETAADPDHLTEVLPEAPGPWQRTDENGGIVEYRIAGGDGVCAAAKLLIRPDVLGEHAARIDRKQGCKNAGTDRFENLDALVETVNTELEHAPADGS